MLNPQSATPRPMPRPLTSLRCPLRIGTANFPSTPLKPFTIPKYFGGEHLFFTDVRLTSRLFTTPHLFISSNLDLKPLAIYSRNVPNCNRNGTVNCWKIGDTYGGGGSVGFQFALRNSWRWQPFFDADGGLIAFTHDVPFPNTRRVNLTLDYGPGALIHLRGNNAIRAGVWVFHFSNASSTAYRWNPGFDGLMLYVAYTHRNLSPLHLHW